MIADNSSVVASQWDAATLEFLDEQEDYSSDNKASVTTRIKQAAVLIFEIIASTCLYLISPTLFCAGCIFGVVFEEQSNAMLDKGIRVWDAQHWAIKLTIVFTGAVMALPICLSTGAFFQGTLIGTRLAAQAEPLPTVTQKPEEEPANIACAAESEEIIPSATVVELPLHSVSDDTSETHLVSGSD